MRASQVPSFASQIKAALSVLNVAPSGDIGWYGWPVRQLEPTVLALLDPGDVRDFVVGGVRDVLYQRFYCTGQPVRRTRRTPLTRLDTTAQFIAGLAAANSGTDLLDAGWRLTGAAAGAAVRVRKGDVTLAAPRDKIADADNSHSSIEEAPCTLRLPTAYLGLSPGYFLVKSEIPLPEVSRDQRRLVRLYWNIGPDGAAAFISNCTTLLNSAGISFTAKVLSDPRRFERRDSAVLYLSSSDLLAAREALTAIAKALDSSTLPGVPALTMPIARGVGFAVDPGNGDSFGLHRCGLLAEGVARTWEHPRSLDATYAEIVSVFRANGLSIDVPYVDTAPLDQEFEQLRWPQHQGTGFVPRASGRGQRLSDDVLLDAASHIGNKLVADAIWHERGCTWIGAEPEIAHLSSTQMEPNADATYVSLGPDVYHGTSGIAWFLVELYAATGERRFRDAALGGIEHALNTLPNSVARSALGLYTGWPGVLAAAAYVATVADDEPLKAYVTQLVTETDLDGLETAELDLASGCAGGIIAFLAIDRLLVLDGLSIARKLGEHLMSHARHDGDSVSWRSQTFPKRIHLLGLSHGGAGIGFALVALAHATGCDDYRGLAWNAFNYERRYFDEAEQNWPDFREKLGSSEWKKAGFLNFMTSWCHGAPGIALSRLYTQCLTGDEICAAEADIALETTARVLQNSLAAANGNFSLCHGWCGNADVLLAGSVTGEGQREHYADLANLVGKIGIQTYIRPDRPFPIGVAGGQSPTMMLGDAGIGYFYLRLREQRPPSILLIDPHNLAGRLKAFPTSKSS